MLALADGGAAIAVSASLGLIFNSRIDQLLWSAVFIPVWLLLAILLALGIGLVLDNGDWHFGQGWIILGLALFASAFLIGAAFQSRAAINAQRAVETGDHDEAARQFRRWSWGMRLILLLLLLATWDMVAKPGL